MAATYVVERRRQKEGGEPGTWEFVVVDRFHSFEEAHAYVEANICKDVTHEVEMDFSRTQLREGAFGLSEVVGKQYWKTYYMAGDKNKDLPYDAVIRLEESED